MQPRLRHREPTQAHRDLSVDLLDAIVRRKVLCLGCGHVYVKPFGCGTRFENPGCPSCCYVGWAEPAAAGPATATA